MSDQEQVHAVKLKDRARCRFETAHQYDVDVSRQTLVEHLTAYALRTDGPYTLRSGAISDWYIDARQTTFDGAGARLVGEAVLSVLHPEVAAVGGMTMGADPIAVATALVAAEKGHDLKAFSIRKEEKDHGTGGRLVGPVDPSMPVAVLEDTTTTGGAAVEAARYLLEEGFSILQAIALVDRSNGKASTNFAELGIDHIAVVKPEDLGVIG
jgi:orotate phosphoribosyltransferase